MDSTSSYVRSNLLKLLTILAESGESGFESVMNALDYQKVRTTAPLASGHMYNVNGMHRGTSVDIESETYQQRSLWALF